MEINSKHTFIERSLVPTLAANTLILAKKFSALEKVVHTLADNEKLATTHLVAIRELLEAQELELAHLREQFTKKKRLFFSDGFYTTAVAALVAQRQRVNVSNYLIISIDHQNAQANIDFAVHCGFSREQIELVTLEQLITFADLRHKAIFWDEVYYLFFNELEKLRKNFFFDKLFIFEEGLETYGQLNNSRLRGEVKTFCFFPNIFSENLNLEKLRESEWKKLLGELNKFYNVPLVKTEKNILYCQSSLYHGAPDVDARNLAFIEKILDKGFHIWCRLHPRYDNTLTEFFRKKAGEKNPQVSILEREIPLGDIFMAKNADKLAAVIGEHGTSLQNAQLLGIPAYRLEYRCDHPERFAHFDFLRLRIPDIEEFTTQL